MMVRGKRDIKLTLLKYGVALALSFAGFLYSRLRTRKINPSSTRPAVCPPDDGSEDNFEESIGQQKEDLHARKVAPSSSGFVSNVYVPNTDVTSMNNVINDKSQVRYSLCHQKGETDEFLLPEFNNLLNEVEFGSTIVGNSFNKDKSSRSKVESSKAYINPEKDDSEQEVRHLRNMIGMLQERERVLEVQLLEYCGLREQEAAMMELQNRLKISHMEAKMFNLKIETLQNENRRLEAQVADHAKVVGELEAARAKIKMLKKKLRHEAEQNREQIITLQQRVAKLQDQESKAIASDRDIQVKLQKLKELESEVEELRKSNMRLQIDNSDLARKLDSTQILANAVLEDPEADALKEESERLRHHNESLLKDIEQLQADRCSDAEELVYLRWINACLRYELRNYQAPAGKTVARDLSKTLSPTSEKKAKKLILEYANADGNGEGGASIMDCDSDQWSSSQDSSFMNSEERDDISSVDYSSAARTNNSSSKAKFFHKLRRLVRGKDSHDSHNRVSSSGEKSGTHTFSNSPQFCLSISTGNDAGAEGGRHDFATLPRTSRSSVDLNRLMNSEEDTQNTVRPLRFRLGRGRSVDFRNFSNDIPDPIGEEITELAKYAAALKDTAGSSRKLHRKSASYNC